MPNPATNYQLPTTARLRVAIVHDWLVGGGAELVVEQLHKMYPDAPIYTSYCNDEWRKRLNGKVVTGYLQHWPFSRLRKFLPLLRQWWFARLDLSDFDLVISSSGNGEAKFVKVKKPAIHICYCHSPTHFYWRHYDYYKKSPGFGPRILVRIALKLFVKPLRKNDYKAAQAVDYFIANSTHIQSDIKKYYRRESVVIHPPVNTKLFSTPSTNYQLPSTKSGRSGFVTVGRQVPYKRVDLIVDVCTKHNLPLKVLGVGPEHNDLVNRAGPSVEFFSPATFEEVVDSLKTSEAFILAAFEDFGITPVEALAAGTPVIAYGKGGALDYVNSKNGVLFQHQTVDSLYKAIAEFRKIKFNHSEISQSAESFSIENFQKKFKQFISECTK